MLFSILRREQSNRHGALMEILYMHVIRICIYMGMCVCLYIYMHIHTQGKQIQCKVNTDNHFEFQIY